MATAAAPAATDDKKVADSDSFNPAALGKQHDSNKPTMPSFSFGTGQRDVARNKVFISKKHETKKATMNSPGPVYNTPSTLGAAPSHRFGSEIRQGARAKYPDSSVDLACAIVDSQKLKFVRTPGLHFGTESRTNTKNAELLRAHPGAAFGTESPGALEYEPNEKLIIKDDPKYSFGPKKEKVGEGNKPVTRLQLPLTSVPRHVGPGSHKEVSGLGLQPQSARESAPSWRFGSEDRDMLLKRGGAKTLLETSDRRSALGTQICSSARTAPRPGFGSETRDMRARTHLVRVRDDQGPSAFMEKQRFHYDLPARTPNPIPKTGM